MATSSFDVKIWNPNTNWTLIGTYTNHSCYVIEWINEQTIASCGDDQTIEIWSISTGSIQRTINVGYDVLSLKMMSNGLYLACGTRNGPLYIYSRPSLIQTR